MECEEHEEDTGESVEVVYTDEGSETLVLCDQCQDDYEAGEFVVDVIPVEAE